MRSVNQIAGLVFLGLGAFAVFEAINARYWFRGGPGPGFFPLWLGITLGGLTLVWIWQVSRGPDSPIPSGLVPDRRGALRMGITVVALVLFLVTMDFIGYRVSSFVFLVLLMAVLGRQNPAVTLVLALFGSFGLYWVFNGYLQVHLPAATFEPLMNLGL